MVQVILCGFFQNSVITAVTFLISCSLKDRLYKLNHCYFSLCLVFKCTAFSGLQSRHLKYGKSTCFLYDMLEISAYSGNHEITKVS